MTAKDFIAKFAETEHNEHILEDIACPSCGHRESFRIEAQILALVFDDGTERDESDCDWADDSYCQCCECGFRGTVGDFTIEGLDALLEETINEPA